MKPKSDGEIYEEISRKINPELHAEIDKWLDKMYNEKEELGIEFAQVVEDNFWEIVLK